MVGSQLTLYRRIKMSRSKHDGSKRNTVEEQMVWELDHGLSQEEQEWLEKMRKVEEVRGRIRGRKSRG